MAEPSKCVDKLPNQVSYVQDSLQLPSQISEVVENANDMEKNQIFVQQCPNRGYNRGNNRGHFRGLPKLFELAE